MYAVVELKYDEGKKLIVKIKWIFNFKPKYNKTDTFLCFWSNNFEDSPDEIECGYSKTFKGEPSIFKVFISKLAESIDVADKYLKGKRVRSVAKRFRDSENTDAEIKLIEAKKKRTAKKELKAHKAQALTANMEYFINDLKVQSPLTYTSIEQMPCTSTKTLTTSEEQNSEVMETSEALFDIIPSMSFEQLVQEVMNDDDDDGFSFQLDTSLDEQLVNIHSDAPHTNSYVVSEASSPMSDITANQVNTCNNSDAPPITSYIESEVSKSIEDIAVNQVNACNHERNNIILLNVEEITKTNNNLVVQVSDLKVEVNDLKVEVNNLKAEANYLKVEVSNLKVDLENANKRNLLLQNYLVAADENVPEVLFIEKDGGRLYRGGVFVNKTQCLVLDQSKTDREYLNNLTMAIFGRKILKTHSLTGAPSNKTKGSAKMKLNSELVQLIYDMMDSRSRVKKTKKLSKTEINAIIGKKISNVTNYQPKASVENQTL